MEIAGVINRSFVVMDTIVIAVFRVRVLANFEVNMIVEAVATMFGVTAGKMVVQGITLVVEAGILVRSLFVGIR
jgi:hypothetical protein